MIQQGIIVGRGEGSPDAWSKEVLEGANFTVLICEDLSCSTARLLSSAKIYVGAYRCSSVWMEQLTV